MARFSESVTMLKKSGLFIGSLLVLLGVGSSCQNESTDPVSSESAYYPVQTGDYWIYEVSQQKYIAADSATKQTYQLQEKISSSYTQNGQLVYLVERSIRKNGQSAWQLSGIYTLYKPLSEVVSQENNVPVVKLLFPINAATSWNTNLYNANPDTLLHYQNPGRAFTVGKRLFENTVSVIGDNDSTLVDQQKYLRVYAQNIGLVYREDLSLAFCQSSPDCVGKGIIASGSTQKWTLIASNHLP